MLLDLFNNLKNKLFSNKKKINLFNSRVTYLKYYILNILNENSSNRDFLMLDILKLKNMIREKYRILDDKEFYSIFNKCLEQIQLNNCIKFLATKEALFISLTNLKGI